MSAEIWIPMREDLFMGHKGKIIITTQERIENNIPPIAEGIIDEDTAHLICNCVNSHNESL